MEVCWKWFREWTQEQRIAFLQRLLPKVVPHKLFSKLAEANLQQTACVDWSDCRTFEQQLVYIDLCLKQWTVDEANKFVSGLEEIDELAIARFYDMIASTVGDP